MSPVRAIAIGLGCLIAAVCATPLLPDTDYGVLAPLDVGAGVALVLIGLVARDQPALARDAVLPRVLARRAFAQRHRHRRGDV